MNKRYFLIFIGSLVLISFFGIILANISAEIETVELGWNIFDYGRIIAEIFSLIFLLLNGTFIKTKYFKWTKGIISIIIIGALLKIMHWTKYGNHIIIVGLIGIAFCYFLHFSKKPIKKRLDYLKILWVLVSYSLKILTSLDLINSYFTLIGSVILLLTVIEFALTEKTKQYKTQKIAST